MTKQLFWLASTRRLADDTYRVSPYLFPACSGVAKTQAQARRRACELLVRRLAQQRIYDESAVSAMVSFTHTGRTSNERKLVLLRLKLENRT